MKNIPYQGMCYFSDISVFKEFKATLKRVFLNSDLQDVTVNQISDDVIVVFEWTKDDSDLNVSHALTEKVVQDFGGTYHPGKE